MDTPAFTFSLPADQAEHLRKMLEQGSEHESPSPATPITDMGRIDMSSNEPHITNECPFCHHAWMDKVRSKGECPGCRRPYTMETMERGQVSVGWSISPEEAEKMKRGDA